VRYSLEVYPAPALEPVTRAEAKTHLRVDHADEDALIDTLILAARKHCETICRRAFVEQTLLLRCDGFPAKFRLPRPPFISIAADGLKYYNGSGVLTTLAAAQYQADTKSLVGRIVPAYGCSWPSARGQTDDVQVTYKAGYGATAASVPEPIRLAILFLIGHWYEHRESVVIGANVGTVPDTVEALLADYRIRDEF